MDPIEQYIEQIKDMRNTVRKIAENAPEVKEGKITVEDELQEPAYVLYNNIIDSVVSYFEMPGIQTSWRVIADKIGADAAGGIMSIMAVGISHCSYQAVLHHDEILKREIENQFELIIKRCNDNTADATACKGAISVLRADIEKITSRFKLEEAVGSNINIKPD